MKDLIRLFIQNVLYLIAGVGTASLLSGTLIVFIPVFIFSFFIGELLSYILTASPLEMNKLDALKYIFAILLFTFVFRPAYSYLTNSGVVEDHLWNLESSNYYWLQIEPEYYADASFGLYSPDPDMDENCFYVFMTYYKDSVRQTVPNVFIQWCSELSINTSLNHELVPEYSTYGKDQWFYAQYGRKNPNSVNDWVMYLSPIDYDPLFRGELLLYGFIFGLAVMNGIILLRNSRA